MKTMKPIAAVLAVAASAFALTAGHAAPATGATAQATQVDEPPAMPRVMTDAEMDEAVKASTDVVTFPSAGDASGGMLRAVASDHCKLVSGLMWSRTSGTKYNDGSVGSKPRLTSCTAGVTKTHLRSAVWMHNGWIWFQAAGPFDSWGSGNMTQKSVEYACKGRGKYPFKVMSIGYGVNSRGQSSAAQQWTDEYKFTCG